MKYHKNTDVRTEELDRNGGAASSNFNFLLRNKVEVLSSEEQKKLLRKAKAGDLESRNKLMEANLPFVVKLAKQYRKSGVDMQELISEGILGLHRAIDKFDVEKQNNYITYAVWWIRSFMMKVIRESKFIRKPVNKILELNAIYKTYNEVRNGSEYRNLSYSDQMKRVAKQLNLYDTYLQAALANKYEVSSLDRQISHGNDPNNQTIESVTDSIADKDNETPEAYLIDKEMRKFVRYCIDKIPEREAEIIRYRFGMKDGNFVSLYQLSKKFNLSKERVRQLEIKAKKRIKNMMHRQGLIDQ